MIKLLVFIILIYHLFYFCDSGTLSASQLAEQTLITTLLNGYNKNIRPDDQVSVDITAALQQIVAIDEKQQIMISSSFISQTWYDDRLSWTPNISNNIEVVMLSVKSLWIPDTMILNSADGNGYLTVNDYSLASVDYTGQVYMILPALTIKTKCNLFVQKFPFDKQICSINLTSWSQGSNRIIYTENDSLVIDTSEYSEHALWKLNGTDMIVIQAEDRAPFEDTYNAVISIQLYLQRKPLFFILNGIFACLILNCVTLLSYVLPFTAQISLCKNIFFS
jgi:nicotinic acetylcholine receptor